MEHFQVSEIEFNYHSGVIEFLLEKGDYLFHVLPRFGEQNSLVFNVEFFFQFLRGVAGISHEYSFQIFV